jgi:hypothetical protein
VLTAACLLLTVDNTQHCWLLAAGCWWLVGSVGTGGWGGWGLLGVFGVRLRRTQLAALVLALS